MAETVNTADETGWPSPPPLSGFPIMDQRWEDAVFLHWRIPESAAGLHMPAGVRPDTFDGSAWVGLIGFRMRQAGLGSGPGIPYFGSFNEVNVRLYSRGPDGVRGVVFRSLDADRLAVVIAARAAGVPYVWSRIGYRGAGTDQGARGYTVRRFGQDAAHSTFDVKPLRSEVADDPLSIHLTARFGMHSAFRGKSFYVPNTHRPWPLYRAKAGLISDSLVSAAGLGVSGPPESVLYSPGVHTQFGRPRLLSAAAAGPVQRTTSGS